MRWNVLSAIVSCTDVTCVLNLSLTDIRCFVFGGLLQGLLLVLGVGPGPAVRVEALGQVQEVDDVEGGAEVAHAALPQLGHAREVHLELAEDDPHLRVPEVARPRGVLPQLLVRLPGHDPDERSLVTAAST